MKVKAKRYKPVKSPPRRKSRSAANREWAPPHPQNLRRPDSRFLTPFDHNGRPRKIDVDCSSYQLHDLYYDKVKPLYKNGDKAEAVKIMVKGTLKVIKERAGFHIKKKIQGEKGNLRRDWKNICNKIAKLGIGKKNKSAEPQATNAFQTSLPKMGQGFQVKSQAEDAQFHDVKPQFEHVQLAAASDVPLPEV